MIDIVPDLLNEIQKDFNVKFSKSSIISRVKKAMDAGTATYKDANDYAEEVGQILADAFKKNIIAGSLPDGRMYFNIAERILGSTLGNNHKLISVASAEIQTQLNKAAGMGIKGIVAELNQDRIKGFVNRVANESDFSKVSWILDEPIVNFSQAIVDDTVKVNAEFHSKAGLSPVLYRIASGQCCDWCDEIAGLYQYPDVPPDVYRRHERCRCRVEYDPGKGKKQSVWSKRWY